MKVLTARGKSGHGFLWHDIAYAVEHAFNTKAGSRLDIGRPIALGAELDLWNKADWRNFNFIRRWKINVVGSAEYEQKMRKK
jgi:hypothetical protein